MNKIAFKPFPFVLLRTPLNSLRYSYEFPDTEYSSLFMEGVYLSSPDLWREFEKLGFKKNEKIEETLSKYWLRSCTRPTPYGTFAGCSIIAVSQQETSLILSDNKDHKRYLRLDMNYVTKMTEEISLQPSLIDEIKFFSNNSIYALHNKLRYVEYNIVGNKREYELSSVDVTQYLSAVLKRAQNGATVNELITRIKEFEDVEDEEARSFIMSLVDEKLLISELDPHVTGAEPLPQLIGKLSCLGSAWQLKNYLEKIESALKSPGSGVDFYRELEADLQKLFSRVTNDSVEFPKHAFQVDLFPKMEKCEIQDELVQEIVAQVSDLMSFSRPIHNSDLDNFKQMFDAKYGNAEMPLAIALDTDVGIGYAGINSGVTGFDDLIDNLPVNEIRSTQTYEADHIVRYVIDKYQELLRGHFSQIEITEEDLKRVVPRNLSHNYPNSMHVMGSLFSKNEKLDKDNFSFSLSSVDGPSGGRFIGRFAHGCEKINHAVQEILNHEECQDQDAIFAEIVHLPQARVGNILLRPVFRKYEIPYVGSSGVAKEFQISIDDLWLRLVNNKIVLFSKKYNKQIIPRLTVAHNFVTNSLPVYKFLCDLQFQGFSSAVIWDWGPLGSLKHLPRVIYKNIIVKKATWRVEEKDLSDMPKGALERIIYLRHYREGIGMPARVVYKEGDNNLLIDFNEAKGITLFLHYLRRNKQLTVDEFLANEGNFVVVDNKKDPYTNEIIIPVFSEVSNSLNQTVSKLDDYNKNIKRNFIPYSEWIYFKIYCGIKMSETLLKTVITPFIEKGIAQGLFECFFFIRYKEKDESPHLRIRFYNVDLEKQLFIHQQFMLLLQPFVERGVVEKISLDTYSRELERYKGNLIMEAEQLFYNDSLAVLRFISLLEEENDQYRMLFAMRGIDLFLNDFRLDLRNKLALAKIIQQSFFLEFGGHLTLQKKLNDRYRKFQRFIFSHMDEKLDQQNGILEGIDIFKNRSDMNYLIIGKIFSKLPEMPETTLFDLLPSYIHMFMNRLFMGKQRKYELVIYHFLERFYASQLAIKKQ